VVDIEPFSHEQVLQLHRHVVPDGRMTPLSLQLKA
jgi:hypothetical protein